MASFDENGKYIKTNWKAGDKITATKLNKIEESIEAVNDNDISRHVEADARLDALEAKDVAHDEELTDIKNAIADNKAAAELGDYEINSRMTFLENELNEGIEEVHNVAETVDGKIATAEANMTSAVNQGKADMEAMVASIRPEITEIQNDVTEIQNDVSGIQSNIGAQISELQEQSRNANAFMEQFEVSHVNKNGYYVLPGGLMLQWGTFSVYFGDAPVYLGECMYNVPFKTEAFSLFIDTNGFGDNASGTAASHNIYSIVYQNQSDKFNIEIKSLSDTLPTGTISLSWFAIGY